MSPNIFCKSGAILCFNDGSCKMLKNDLQQLKLLSQENSINRLIVDVVYHKIGGLTHLT